MTGLLKDTLIERAASVDEPPLDLDAIIRTGDTRIRRRRTTAIVAVAAASVLVIAGGVVTTKHLTDSAPVSGIPTFKDRRPTYATGDQIHWGKDVIKVGPEKLTSFVQVDTGFVYATKSGTVYYTNCRGNGRSDAKIGSGSTGTLAADDDGTLVGWVDERGSAPDQLVVYDVATYREVVRTSTGNEKPPVDGSRSTDIIAIDNNIAYYGAFDGLRSVDLETGKVNLLKAGALPSELSDAANGKLAYLLIQSGGAVTGVAVAPKLGSTKVIGPEDSGGDLSPNAAYLVTEANDTIHLWRSDGSGEIKLKSDYPLLVQSVWLDEDHFATIGIKSAESPQNTTLDLVTCSARTATCTAAIKGFAPYPSDDNVPVTFQVPTGQLLN